MEHKIFKYVEWKDLQNEVCKSMGIDPELFRNYHKVVGGGYKDLWHVWLWYIDERLYNDSIMPIYMDNDFEDDYFQERLKENGYEWAMPFFISIYKVIEENNIEHIRYYW